MGQYLNPGKQNYLMAVNSDIFIDKSEMISFLNSVVKTQQRYVSVSRPRRFGKTMAADMVCAYYGRGADSRALFETLKLSQIKSETEKLAWDKYLGEFDVIRVVMTDFFKKNISSDSALQKLQQLVAREIVKEYPNADYFDEKDLIQTIADAYTDNPRQLVFVIDEWDAIFRESKDDKDGQIRYLDFLRDLLKDKSYIALAYMTGILPIKKYGKHSALNMFDEYSMISPMQLARYTGFTDDEVRELCNEYGRDFDTLKEWYDGYEVSDIIPPDPNYEHQEKTGMEKEAKHYSIYSPLSVLKAVKTGYIQNYWNKTESYEALAKYINMNYSGLKDVVALMMDGGSVKVNTSTYQNDMTSFASKNDVLSLLINLGYLRYDFETMEASIPNKEILDEFRTSTQTEDWTEVFKAFTVSEKLLNATWAKDADKVAELIEDAHNLAGNRTYNDEAALSYAVQYAYYAAQKYYTTILELDTGKGYADIVFIPSPKHFDKPAMVVELKYNKDASTALNQIRQQKYPAKLEHYKGNILLVGINYDKDAASTDPDFKHHTCVIETA
ncbi:MAG: AAA family ATPase [Butyrivibrio sp.]|nr:AAA family ATPase [Butyrivibrio sp.]